MAVIFAADLLLESADPMVIVCEGYSRSAPARQWGRAVEARVLSAYLLHLIGLSIHGRSLMQAHQKFCQERDAIQWRIHVNGIRGKSTVTRYVAAIFREAGVRVFGKTTGTAAMILNPDGCDEDIPGPGFPDINEQIRIVRSFSQQAAEVAVVECMAVNPLYAEWLERTVMKSHIGILTNVRLDHTDYLGQTLEEIAHSLARTTPWRGLLITAEDDPTLRSILEDHARRRQTKMLVATADAVESRWLASFNHFAIEANVAVGFLVAEHLGLDRHSALAAMQSALPDPGAFRVQSCQQGGLTMFWANLFAVNNRESFVALSERLFAQYPDCQRGVILNNRLDRQSRVLLFADLAQQLQFDFIVTFGDFEADVNRVLAGHTIKVLNLGNSTPMRDAAGEDLLEAIIAASDRERPLLLIGTVNIHTPQAERFLEAMASRSPWT